MEKDNIEKKLNFNEAAISNTINTNSVIKEDCDNEDSADKDDVPDSEIEKLENDILLKVLEENFGFKKFLPGQLDVIKNILNGKNTLAVLPPGGGKSLLFQLPSLVLEGLTIVISPFLALITDQVANLPKCLSGASLASFTSHKQRAEIFEGIKEGKIKILFITPERFTIENFSEINLISLVCFDEATFACPLTQNYRSSYTSAHNILKRLKPGVLLFF